MFRCCVDLDKRALNTKSNAFETTAWVRQQGFRSLIVVTSTYHMPRTLIELRQAMPDVELLPYPVKSPRLEEQWWSDPRTAWVLGKEYLKFITAFARYWAEPIPCWGLRSRLKTATRRSMRASTKIALYARSALFYPVLYVNWALFLILGSWLLLGPRRWAMAGLALHGDVTVWLLRVICGTRMEVRGRENLLPGPVIVAASTRPRGIPSRSSR